MNSTMMKTLMDAGAIKKVCIVAEGAKIHIVLTPQSGDPKVATTQKGSIKTWSSIDSASKWLRGYGVGSAELKMHGWMPGQKGMQL